MSKIKIAINGTGRIGLCACRLLGARDDVEVVAINTTASVDVLVHLLRHDSVHGFYGEVEKIAEDQIRLGKHTVSILSHRDPAHLTFGALGAQVVLECTGAFKNLEQASLHLREGVKRVVVSAPMDNAPTFVYGVNHHSYQQEPVISNASCTTNALAPLVKILHAHYHIDAGLMTTIHSYTNDQNLLDVKHKDIRRARAAGVNMIPTSTGAAKAIGLVMPELKGRLNGFAVRVPTPNVSLVDFNFTSQKALDKEEINTLFRQASLGDFKGIVSVDDERLVSSDFVGVAYSSIVVSDCTMVVGQNQGKIVAWYDNEVGYTSRLIDMACWVMR